MMKKSKTVKNGIALRSASHTYLKQQGRAPQQSIPGPSILTLVDELGAAHEEIARLRADNEAFRIRAEQSMPAFTDRRSKQRTLWQRLATWTGHYRG